MDGCVKEIEMELRIGDASVVTIGKYQFVAAMGWLIQFDRVEWCDGEGVGWYRRLSRGGVYRRL